LKGQRSEGGNPKPTPDALPGLPFDAYEIIEMSRSQLKGAEYNPRQISDNEKKRLRAGLKKHKMVMPPTWNRRTGNLVGGHQRLSALDVLAGGAEYSLKVAVIDVTESEEKEINILLNNPQAMGDWDLPKLEDMLKDSAIDLAGTGFDMADVFHLFGDNPMAKADEVQGMADNLRKVRDQYRQNIKSATAKGGTDFYIVVVGRSYAERTEFLERFGMEDNRYQSMDAFLALLTKSAPAMATPTEPES
jgi:hypothetical protein